MGKLALPQWSPDSWLFADTPGLLNRDDTERNKMELLTLSVLQHLPSTVLFVVSAAKGQSTAQMC